MVKSVVLPLISKREEILKNIDTLNGYLGNTNVNECDYAKKLIQRGKCFIAFPYKGEYRFYPSRFMGYVNNTMETHEYMGKKKKETGETTKDGRKTNPVISAILGNLILVDDNEWNNLELSFLKFCKKFDIDPSNKERKYWNFDDS